MYSFCLFIYFIYLFLARWVFVAVRRLSLAAVSGGYSSLRCAGFSLWRLLLLRSTGSGRVGFSNYGTRAQQLWLTGSRVQAQQLWHTGSVAPQHVGSSRTRARIRVPCIGRRILNHCATRKVPRNVFFLNNFFSDIKGFLLIMSAYFQKFKRVNKCVNITIISYQ